MPKRQALRETITQRAVASGKKDFEKRDVLRKLLDNAKDLKNAIIFCNRKRDVATLWRSLEQHGYSCGALHGDMDQRNRTTMLTNFAKAKLICWSLVMLQHADLIFLMLVMFSISMFQSMPKTTYTVLDGTRTRRP